MIRLLRPVVLRELDSKKIVANRFYRTFLRTQKYFIYILKLQYMCLHKGVTTLILQDQVLKAKQSCVAEFKRPLLNHGYRTAIYHMVLLMVPVELTG